MTVKTIGTTKEMDLQPLKGVVADGKEILLVSLGSGRFAAIGNKCTHMGCRLSGGKLEGETVRCPCHGSVFNVRSGEVVKGPAKRPEPSYPLTVRDGDLQADL